MSVCGLGVNREGLGWGVLVLRMREAPDQSSPVLCVREAR